jgi:anti-sigma-K factor RskA
LEIQDIISSGLLELYAAGLASAEERTQVESWVQQYPEVAAELKAIETGVEEYAMQHAVAPAALVKDNIFAAINTTSSTGNTTAAIKTETAKVIAMPNYWKWTAAASIVLLLGSAYMNMMYYNKYDTANKTLQQTQEQLAVAEQHNKEMGEDIGVVHNPYSMPVALKGQEVMPDAAAKVFWMQDTKAVMVDASSLPDAPAGMQYQLWAIVDGVPVDGGMIITNDKGKKFRMQKMKSFTSNVQAFAISLEKEGGNPTPTKVVSVGKI